MKQEPLPIDEVENILYLEYGKLEKSNFSLIFQNAKGQITIPAGKILALQIGPGVTVTSASVAIAAEYGLTIFLDGSRRK